MHLVYFVSVTDSNVTKHTLEICVENDLKQNLPVSYTEHKNVSTASYSYRSLLGKFNNIQRK